MTDLKEEISKILEDQWLTKDKQIDAILALIKKHERAVMQVIIRYIENNPDFYVDGDNFRNMYENTGVIKKYLYKILAKLKNPNGPKEVEK